MQQRLLWLRDSRSLLEVPDAVAALRAAGIEPVTQVAPAERTAVVAVVAGLQAFGDADAAQLPSLRTVARFGAGYDNVDVAALARRGVSVSYTPDVSTDDVAQFAFALLILALRGLPRDAAALKTASSPWRVIGRGVDLGDACVGIVGCGHIGLRVAQLVAPLAAHTLLWNRTDKPIRLTGVPAARYRLTTRLEELAEVCDGVSVHVALVPATRGLIGARFFERAAAHGRRLALVNTARGNIVDEAALLAALDQGAVRDAAIDVWSAEGGTADDTVHRLRHHAAVLPSSHIGAFTVGVLTRCALQCVRNLLGALGSGVEGPVFLAPTAGAVP